MPKRVYKKQLMNLGLADKEADVYLALLDLGSATADQIAKTTKLNRSTTYVQIKSLMSDGLVTTFKKGKKTFFAAESPTHLEQLLEWRRAELEQKISDATTLVPNLMKLFSDKGDRPVVRMFEGKEGLVALRKDILISKPKESLVISNFDRLREIFSDKELLEFSHKRENLKIKSWVLYATTQKNVRLMRHQNLKLLSPESVKAFSTDIYIYDDKVSFANAVGDIAGVTIQNNAIADTMRSLFWSYWETTPETHK